MRVLVAVVALLAVAPPAQAQLRDRINLERVNRRLEGRIVDYSHNHGADLRLFSPALGMPRDLYVYLPPGYDPARAYPLLVYFHMASVDEHTFAGSRRVLELDRMICRGEFPPTVVVAIDGLISGENGFREAHSLFIDGCRGAFQTHVVAEVLPFVMSRYSIRPERQAHAVLGVSAGGFGAMNLALKHREFFGIVATLAGPLNLRYSTCGGDRPEDFDPATFRWRTTYDPDQVIGRFYLGLWKVRAKKYIEPVFGCRADIPAWITAENPADLLFTTDLKPGELAIYVNYPGRDSYNFDAQAESFAWLAAQKGVAVDLECDPHRGHTLPYFAANHARAFRWLACHLAGPVPRGSLTTENTEGTEKIGN